MTDPTPLGPDPTTLVRLFRHKAVADERTAAAMQGLDARLPATDIARRVLGHTYVVDRIFAAHLTGTRHGHASANPAALPALDTLAAQLRDSDRWYVDYVEALDPAALAEWIDFEFTDGEPGRMSREEMLMHVVTHGSGHRGQLGWMMALADVAPPADGFASYLHDAEGAARRRPACADCPAAGPPPRHWPAPFSTLAELTARLRSALADGVVLGRTLKIDLAKAGIVCLDGVVVTNDERPAELTLLIAMDDLQALAEGRLTLAAALASGRLGVSDLEIAVGLRAEIGTLLARLR